MSSTREPLESSIASGPLLLLSVSASSATTALAGSCTTFSCRISPISKKKWRQEKPSPAFTFCNINPLRKSALTACDIEHLREIWHIPAEHTENITSPMYEVNGKVSNTSMGPKQSDHAVASLTGKGCMGVQLTARGTW